MSSAGPCRLPLSQVPIYCASIRRNNRKRKQFNNTILFSKDHLIHITLTCRCVRICSFTMSLMIFPFSLITPSLGVDVFTPSFSFSIQLVTLKFASVFEFVNWVDWLNLVIFKGSLGNRGVYLREFFFFIFWIYDGDVKFIENSQPGEQMISLFGGEDEADEFLVLYDKGSEIVRLPFNSAG